jgi:hypothetical protein
MQGIVFAQPTQQAREKSGGDEDGGFHGSPARDLQCCTAARRRGVFKPDAPVGRREAGRGNIAPPSRRSPFASHVPFALLQ